MNTCLICGNENWSVMYQGPIRTGSFGRSAPVESTVHRCLGCGAGYLPAQMDDLEAYYKSGDYRNDLEQGNAVDTYFQLTDDDQPSRMEYIGQHSIRDNVVADIGCGAGPFLDLCRGVAAETLAVEPNQAYHSSLRERGHHVSSLSHEALPVWENKVDLAVSFSVLEHVKNPRTFLEEIRNLLKPGGSLVLSTPNARDQMIEWSPEYAAFFYRKVHLWYFDANSLKTLAQQSGFSIASIDHRHRFDLSNALLWLRDKKPSGQGALPVSSAMSSLWRQQLEESGRADYLYARLIKN